MTKLQKRKNKITMESVKRISISKENSSHLEKNIFPNQEEEETKELLISLNTIYSEVVNEFKNCLEKFQSGNSTFDREEHLLTLNNMIMNAHIKFKLFEKKKSFNNLAQVRQEMVDNLLKEFPSYPEILRKPLGEFKAILKCDEKEPSKTSQQIYQQSLQKNIINNEFVNKTISAQSRLNLIKEAYERIIEGINAYLDSLVQRRNDSLMKKKILFDFIDTAAVQFRSAQRDFPQEYHNAFIVTFESIEKDFKKFKEMVPERYKRDLFQAFSEFEFILNSILAQRTLKWYKKIIRKLKGFFLKPFGSCIDPRS